MYIGLVERAFELAREGYIGDLLRARLAKEGYSANLIQSHLESRGLRTSLKRLAASAASNSRSPGERPSV